MKFLTLISPEQLANHLEDPNWVIFDCRFTLKNPESGRQSYDKSHIPGARYAHLNEDLSGKITATSGRHPLPDPLLLAKKLGQWGVNKNTQVVVYDDSFSTMAVRMWWLLKWLGHDAVALLDGGLPLWIKEGREISAVAPKILPTEFHATVNDSMWVDSVDVQQALQQHKIVIDARAEERFLAYIEPLDKIAGHIPGTINSPVEDNLDNYGKLLSADELRTQYQQLIGESPPEQVIHMCGSGVTACQNILAMEIAGLSGSKLYVGSWSEWITDPSRPVSQGE
ncbi:sulfurtransferase [Sulfurirhabdus autotrophica]|uniref:Thiosulfate/3-mercaptopyruvate sulfurtransferase n=1 Tax=Sulfurirhabdus autotrophica TaxID=1706046 RepID=A0A4R3Y8Q4_9PROT|nr:sulfurtransferase [Sulfurirhabdus autotrophica]TCV86693.1 thiosulfate/3-mercaptopyruvate sulfurtransferase [Sulfurirhabdus autotrophica]